RRRGDTAQAEVATQLAAQPVHNLPVYEILDEEGLETIHRASMQILSEIGIDFYDDEALFILKEHGADVEGETARFDEALVLEYVAKAPVTFTQLARNPERNVVVGGNHLTFAPVYGPPFVMDMERGRRSATLKDFQNFVRLSYLSPYLQHSGAPSSSRPTSLLRRATWIWSTATSASATSRSWALSCPRRMPPTVWRWPRSSLARRLSASSRPSSR